MSPTNEEPSRAPASGSGLYLTDGGGGRPWKLAATSAAALVQVLGRDLLSALVRCFAASDRLAAIFDSLSLSDAQYGPETIRAIRNKHVLVMFSVGTVYEIQEGLKQLHELGVERHLSEQGRARWEVLATFAELKNESAIAEIRNCLAFHLGDDKIVKRGIDRRAAETGELVIATGEGHAKIDVRHDFAIDLVLAGMTVRPAGVAKGTPNSRRPLSGEDTKAAIGEVSRCHFALVSLLDELLHDALREAGAKLPPLPPIDTSDLPPDSGQGTP